MSEGIDLVQAVSALPHGPSFRFVDRLLSITPGQEAQAEWTLKGDEAFLAGHFPGAPLLPGVIMIEALAQLGGILAQNSRTGAPMRNVRLTAVRQFKILGSIPPGEKLTLTAVLEAVMPGLVQVRGEIHTQAQIKLAQGSIVLSGDEDE
jgi:3-hydroxyacyl-[acyl-carrier-protein] dehydratase